MLEYHQLQNERPPRASGNSHRRVRDIIRTCFDTIYYTVNGSSFDEDIFFSFIGIPFDFRLVVFAAQNFYRENLCQKCNDNQQIKQGKRSSVYLSGVTCSSLNYQGCVEFTPHLQVFVNLCLITNSQKSHLFFLEGAPWCNTDSKLNSIQSTIQKLRNRRSPFSFCITTLKT